MDGTIADGLHDWHDFYLLIGTASATLVGLTFVAATVAASFFDVEREAAARVFLTPTVLHFTAVLIACLVAISPPGTPISHSSVLLLGGMAGIGYTCRLWILMHRHGFTKTIDWTDRSCYVFLPIVSYLLIAGAAILLIKRPPLGLDLLALILVLLLLLGIRNAWDMTLWIALRAPNKE